MDKNKPLEEQMTEEQKAEQAQLAKEIDEKSNKIAAILQEEPAMIFKPYLHFSQEGVIPQVALVKLAKKEEKPEVVKPTPLKEDKEDK